MPPFSEGTLSTYLLSQSGDAAKRTLPLPYTTHIPILSLMSWATLSILGEVNFILISNNHQDDDHDQGWLPTVSAKSSWSQWTWVHDLLRHPQVSHVFSNTPFSPHCRPPLVWFPSLLSKLQVEIIQDPSGDRETIQDPSSLHCSSPSFQPWSLSSTTTTPPGITASRHTCGSTGAPGLNSISL